MPPEETQRRAKVRYTRELGFRQVVSLGLRAALPVVAFLSLGETVRLSGADATLALVLAVVVWLPTILSYLELAQHTPVGGIYETIAKQKEGFFPFVATWVFLLALLLAAGLLARQTARLLIPGLAPFPLLATSPYAIPILAIVVLLVAFLIAIFRRRPWHRADDAILFGGIVAILIVFVVSLVGEGFPRPTGSLGTPGFGGALTGALPLILIVGVVEAVGEWKADLRRTGGDSNKFSLFTLAILVVLTALILIASLRMDPFHLATGGLAAVLNQANLQATWLVVTVLFTLLLINAMSSLLLRANRILRQLAREGFLPDRRDKKRNYSAGVLTAALLAAFAALLEGNTGFAALTGMALLFAACVNFADIFFRPKIPEDPGESKAQGLFRLPFPPLIPAAGLVATLLLSTVAGLVPYISIAVALAAAFLIFLLFGRDAHKEAQEVKATIRKEAAESEVVVDRFRVLVPLVGTPAEHRALLRLATDIARAEDGEVLAVQVISLPPQLTRAEGARMARERTQLLNWSLGQVTGDVPFTPITRIGRDPGHAIVDTAREEDADMILITWRPEESTENENGDLDTRSANERRRLVGQLVQGTPCTVVALDGELKQQTQRILLPTAGGPHAREAAGLALKLARIWDAQVVGVYIVRKGPNELNASRARDLVKSTFEDLPDADHARIKLVNSQEPIAAALVEEAEQQYDLIMLGATNEGLLDRVLFGDIPHQVVERTETPAIMVRSAQPEREAFARLWWDRTQSLLPVLDGEEQLALHRTLQAGANPSVSYFVLIVLSAIIATLGLWQNSGAVIIGAMLVAPLMTPIMATSLGIVMSDARMIRISVEATVKGVAAGIGVALIISLIVPEMRIGSEIMSRTQPTVLDLVIALASGAAGAYAIGRKEVSAALPGVAIAAALMPPLCTVGIGLALFSGAIAGGAMLLFLTNLIAITMAGGLVFLLLGVRPLKGSRTDQQRLKRSWWIALLLLVLISIPLTLIGIGSVEEVRFETAVKKVMNAALDPYADSQLLEVRVDRRGKVLKVYARVSSTAEAIDPLIVEEMSQELAEETGRPVHLEVDVQPVIRLKARSP
ncbi:MAG: DUF389 domain-containing protein [Chloroflexota bacterium]|nr:DUF389 domain-containing protein [Chloroflexota bacterium]